MVVGRDGARTRLGGWQLCPNLVEIVAEVTDIADNWSKSLQYWPKLSHIGRFAPELVSFARLRSSSHRKWRSSLAISRNCPIIGRFRLQLADVDPERANFARNWLAAPQKWPNSPRRVDRATAFGSTFDRGAPVKFPGLSPAWVVCSWGSEGWATAGPQGRALALAGAAPRWGLARSARIEMPRTAVKCVDVAVGTAAAGEIVGELGAPEGEARALCARSARIEVRGGEAEVRFDEIRRARPRGDGGSGGHRGGKEATGVGGG